VTTDNETKDRGWPRIRVWPPYLTNQLTLARRSQRRPLGWPRSVGGTKRAPRRASLHWTMVVKKVRLRFAKRGDLRLVSHHDLMRCLERLLRRAQIPVAHTQGFNPRPKVVFTLALALGIEGRREVVELELAEPLDPAEVLSRLRAQAPSGLEFLEAHEVEAGRPVQAGAVQYEFEVPADRREAAAHALQTLLASECWTYTRQRPDRTVEFDLRPFVLSAELDLQGVLQFRLKMVPSGSVRPEEVIDALGLRDLLGQGVVLARTEIELAP
jgi:radical SAM-linked protein